MTDFFVDPNRVIDEWSTEDGADWDTAYASLQDCLDNAVTAYNNDVVYVRAGVIRPTNTTHIEIPATTTLYGGMMPASVENDNYYEDEMDNPAYRNLECWITQIYGDDDTRCIFDIEQGVTIDGFFLTHGKVSSDHAGAIYLNVDTVTIQNCYFYHCYATSSHDGGALRITGEGISIENCEFGMCYADGDGGAIQITGNASVDFTRCWFSSNEATGDGGAVNIDQSISPHINFIQCIFDHNVAAGNGGAICNDAYGFARSDGCTIMDNESGGYGGGIYNNIAAATFYCYNTIARGNTAASGGDNVYSLTLQSYSNVQGGPTGSGNIDTDPQFRDSGVHPFEPNESSGNCDAADTSTTYYEATDFRGRARYNDPDQSDTGFGPVHYADIGAYEYIGCVPAYAPYTHFKMSYVIPNYASTSSGKGGDYFHYFVMRAPEAPPWWRDHSSLKPMKFEFQREVMIDDTDAWMRIDLIIGGETVLQNSQIQPSVAHTSPDWEEDFSSVIQDRGGSETYAALMETYPDGYYKCERMAEDHKLWFVVGRMNVSFSADSYNDLVDLFNVWFEPVHDDAGDARDDYTFKLAIHNDETVTDRYEPDMPVDAYLIKEVLMMSLMRIQYELNSPHAVPVFGDYYGFS